MLYKNLNNIKLRNIKNNLKKELNIIKNKKINLDLSRGKQSKEQLNLSTDMLKIFNKNNNLNCNIGFDCRNYGLFDGIPEAKKLLGDILDVSEKQVMICGNSSLSIMFSIISKSFTHGVCGNKPWYKFKNIKFLCPSPGYDRHFKITEYFGIKLINIPMTSYGPDINMIEKLVNSDITIKGIWCVPKYSNPQGITYSDYIVKKFAQLKPAANDFRIFWDNAYCVHHLYEKYDSLLNIINECKNFGNSDLVYEFISTSKITFSGSGIAAVISSKNNLNDFKKYISTKTIGYDKINQLRHVKFFKNAYNIYEHMKKHAKILRVKFNIVNKILKKEIGIYKFGTWTVPNGGYFISFNCIKGCAKKIIKKSFDIGLKLTEAGATFPYKFDPYNNNIRIAPTFPNIKKLKLSMKIFVLVVKLISIDKLLN